MPPKKAVHEDGARGPSSYKELSAKVRQNGKKKSAEYSIYNKEGEEVRRYKINQSDSDAKTSQSETGKSVNKQDWNVHEYDNAPDREVIKKESSVPYAEKTPKYIFRGFDVNVDKFGGSMSCVACGGSVSAGAVCDCGVLNERVEGGRRRRKSSKASGGKKRSSKSSKGKKKGSSKASKGKKKKGKGSRKRRSRSR